MLRFRFVLALLATTAPPAAGQFMERLPCAGGDFYAPCALTAGRIPDLRTMYFKAGEREIRYSSVYGRDSHSRLLVIHERDGIVTGRLFLVMYSNLMGSQFAQESCLDQYWVGRQGICVRRPAAEEPDWADVLRRLDALGVAELPSYPAPPFPEDTTPLPPTKPGMLPVDRVSRILWDGPSYSIQLRNPELYWSYQVPSMPDPAARASKRDAEIVRLLECTVARYGGGACRDDRDR
ncbi:MAG: hypothetical protein IPO52_10120 [Gemmatimonadetes bacterium]|jgi:hypothetical protein|nr:hypothetical protein [Gemmatimonadota bacterium]MBP6443261.1 hypothetical protein [Gemmatimonadales bacterium]MBP6569864.1 hypothetical protein [Gemmatimonadales bacterium]MBP7619539.1 hypothetical protein [Gemmatimonadales bacterium]MBP9898472.1 hypothetical protein [Gemmatimonadales bacterium]